MLCLLVAAPAAAFSGDLHSASIRSRVGDKRVLGKEQPQSFREIDVMASLRWPTTLLPAGMGLQTRLLASGGVMHGAGKTALVGSLMPALAWTSRSGLVDIDLGAGLALMTSHSYAQQDFGGHLQFALTLGVGAPVHGRFGLGYRFLHYSDAGAYGPGTIGADFHMIELIYRF